MPRGIKPLTIKWTAEQRQRIARAAQIVGRERGGQVPTDSALIREETMKGVDAILARTDTPAIAA